MLSRRTLHYFRIFFVMAVGIALMTITESAFASAPGTELTIVNENDGGATFDYIYDGNEFSLADGESFSSVPYFAGDKSIFQQNQVGFQLSIECVDDAQNVQPIALIGDNGVTVNVPDGVHITCTFTNTDIAGSFAILATSNGPDTFDFQYGSESFSLANGEQFDKAPINPGNYTVYQTILPGYLVDVTCTGGDVTVLSNYYTDNGVTMHVDPNEDIVCTFNNNYVGATISFTNEIVGGTATSIQYNTVNFNGIYTMADGETLTLSDVLPTTASIYGTLPTGYAAEFDCTGTTANPLGANGVELQIAANEQINCVATFTYVAGTVTINSIVDVPSPMPFEYETSFGNFSIANNESFFAPVVMPGNQQIVFENLQEDYDLYISCNGGGPSLVGSNGVFFTLAPNEDVVCDFVNTFTGYIAPLGPCVFAQYSGDALRVEEFAKVDCDISSNGKAELKNDSAVMGNVTSLEKEIYVGERVVVDGDLVATRKIEVKYFSEVSGSVTSNDEIKVKHDAVVFGDATAADKVDIDEAGTVVGTVSAYASVPTLAPMTLPTLNIVGGSTPVDVKRETPQTVMPGVYEKLKVESDGTITLVAGEYTFEEFVVDNDSIVYIDLSGGSLQINVQKKIELKDRVQMVLVGDSSAESIVFRSAEGDVALGKDSTFYGTFLAPQAHIDLDENSTLDGALYGEKVHIKKYATLNFAPANDVLAEIFDNG